MRNLARSALPVLLILAALLLLSALGMGIPCLFHQITGLYCPGCGATRMALALLRLDFAAAFRYNGALCLILPFLGAVLAVSGLRYLRTGQWTLTGRQTAAVWVMAAALVIFGILRNLPALAVLRPPP